MTGGMEMPVNNRRQSRESGWEGEVSNSVLDEFHLRILQYSQVFTCKCQTSSLKHRFRTNETAGLKSFVFSPRTTWTYWEKIMCRGVSSQKLCLEKLFWRRKRSCEVTFPMILAVI